MAKEDSLLFMFLIGNFNLEGLLVVMYLFLIFSNRFIVLLVTPNLLSVILFIWKFSDLTTFNFFNLSAIYRIS